MELNNNKDKLKLDNCISITNDIINEATITNIEISKQAEQLNRIDKDINNIQENIEKVDSVLNKMLYYVNIFRKKIQTKVLKKDILDNSININIETQVQNKPVDKLDELLNLTNKLKQISMDTNNSLDKQNNILNNLDDTFDISNSNIKEINNKINKLL